jgi:predicted ATP-dependent endonuclease of OLD family
MKLAHIDIHNFRRLKSCRIQFAPKETIFVGANNSGKTSAMTALLLFLKKSRRAGISTLDFTVSNWNEINGIGEKWVVPNNSHLDIDFSSWYPLVPTMDVWLDVGSNDLHHVRTIIPTLDWKVGLLGVRLVFCPDDIQQFYKDYKAAWDNARKTENASPLQNGFKLSPKSLKDFLEMNGNLNKIFKMKFYIIDPKKASSEIQQLRTPDGEPLETDPFANLIKIDVINAQRGFNDANPDDDATSDSKRLSSQLKKYYDKHLDPKKATDVSDIEVLSALENSKSVFDDKLKTSFSKAINELENLNYPGFSNPKILLSSKMNPTDTLDHDASVQFELGTSTEKTSLTLPERYNGLGYQNLISMFFSLIRFRDEWMQIGKATSNNINEDVSIEPLHLVFIEEPEAHLHAQVQQVFIKKAYNLLRNHDDLKTNEQFSTQLIVSTHSSYIAHETDFTSLRYFKRTPAKDMKEVPSSIVKNLSNVFGDANETSKFATRYLKTTHCDLFFADAIIIVEGHVERMLVPHFIEQEKYEFLNRSYTSLLEIGGSHAHRLKPLIEELNIPTLIITDLDSIGADNLKKVRPEMGEKFRTGNDTLKKWIPRKELLDELMSLQDSDKMSSDGFIRVAFPFQLSVPSPDGTKTEDVIPYTFEDALALNNIDSFKNLCKIGQTYKATGLMKKIQDALTKPTLKEVSIDIFNALLESPKKAEMACDLIFLVEPDDIKPPQYIEEGLDWLQKKLNELNREQPILPTEGGIQ